MRQLTRLLMTGAVLGSLGVAVWWTVRHPNWAIHEIRVEGDTAHNSAATLRANVAPKLRGNFYTLDLSETKSAFEAVPWVRRAVVQRVFPDRLLVRLQEHQPVALWGQETEPRLLNSFGEVFEANVGDVEQDDLPRLSGPDLEAPNVLAMYRSLQDMVSPLDWGVTALLLNRQGAWQLLLDTGAWIELGNGNNQDVLERMQRFVRTVTQISGKYGRRADAVQSADLRYAQGYALRLRGVETTTAETPAAGKNKR